MRRAALALELRHDLSRRREATTANPSGGSASRSGIATLPRPPCIRRGVPPPPMRQADSIIRMGRRWRDTTQANRSRAVPTTASVRSSPRRRPGLADPRRPVGYVTDFGSLVDGLGSADDGLTPASVARPAPRSRSCSTIVDARLAGRAGDRRAGLAQRRDRDSTRSSASSFSSCPAGLRSGPASAIEVCAGPRA